MLRYFKYFRILISIIIRKPLLMRRLLKNYFQIFLLRKPLLRKVEIGINFDCQCACAKCSSCTMKNTTKSKMTLDQYKKLSDQLIQLGTIHINITGGEVLLEENILEIIRNLSPKKMLISLNSNGILLSTEKIDQLVDAGVDIIKLSIDSPVKEEHDDSRGVPGCFDKVISALSYLKTKRRVLGHISTVCTKEILHSGKIWDIVKIAQKYNALLGVTVPTLSGKWKNNESVLLDNTDRNILKTVCKTPFVVRDVEEGYTKKCCPAGSEELYVTCYGDVIPCPFIQISFGNILEEKLREIWSKMRSSEMFNDKRFAGCLAGEEHSFIDKNLKPLRKYENLPVAHNQLKDNNA